MRSVVVLLAAVVLGLGASATAHAEFKESAPAPGAAVTDPLTSIELSFTEGVEVDFSTFKLVRLDADVDLSEENAQQRLNGLAAAIIGPYLRSSEPGDGEVAVEAVAVPDDRSLVELRLAEPLAPGHYVVMWRLLSADTHVVDGHFVFSVTEEP